MARSSRSRITRNASSLSRTAACLVALGGGALAGCPTDPPDRHLDASMQLADTAIPVTCDHTEDADGDGLYDDYETDRDTDMDGVPNSMDTDSDGDGYPDMDEAGALGGCAARDTDVDGLPDYIDNDSDNDGLSDGEERDRYFTNPLSQDTDGDGFDDLAEAVNDEATPLDPLIGINPEDFYVVLPYNDPAVNRTLQFNSRVRQADVFFMMDRTGSMTEEVTELKRNLETVVTGIADAIPDIGVGFGGFAGFGGRAAGGCTTVFGVETCQDGPEGDTPFHLYSTITTDRAQMLRDVMLLDADQGGANWASWNEALFQAATGDGVLPWVPAQTCMAIPDEIGRRYGYPCFRPGSLPIMVVLTDTSSKNGPLTMGVSGGTYDTSGFTMGRPRTYTQTLGSLSMIGARVIGVMSITGGGSDCGPQISDPTCIEQFDVVARDTGTVDAAGDPITFQIGCDGSGLGTGLVHAIQTLATETPQNIRGDVRDGDDFPPEVGPVDATLFVKAITPTQLLDGGTVVTCPMSGRCDDRDFFDVRPGQRVEFDVRFLNDFVPPRRTAQVFRATIFVVGNGIAELDARDVTIVVPAGSVIDLI
ncbi:MAG: hypothetical protein K1X94_11560 [Sandaracinaceae bacterium]|nr:hypothetical protein [Sandaracinaceae bacterium]